MVRNVDFPEYSFTYSPSSGTVTLPRFGENAFVIAAFYNENGVLTKTERFDADAYARAVTASPASENVKVFLWDSSNGIKPLSDTAKILDAAQ